MGEAPQRPKPDALSSARAERPPLILTWKKILLFLGVYLLLAVGSAVIVGLLIKGGIDATTGSLRSGQIAACHRSDIQAAKDNRSQFADWSIDKLFVLAIAHPQQRARTREQKRLTAAFGPIIRDAVLAKSWVPLAHDCGAVIAAHGSKFVPAQPIAFDQKLPTVDELAVPPAKAALPAARLLHLLQRIR